MLAAGKTGKTLLGVVLVVLGILIVSGIDKRLEAFIVEHSPDWLIDITTRF
jgi:hypothetical protein